MCYLTKISGRISDLMIENNVSCSGLAIAVGVNESTVSRWKRGELLPRLKYLLKIADYFSCSLEFLTGRSETYLDFDVNTKYPPISDRLREVIKFCNKSINQIDTNTNIKDYHFSKWKRGQEPHILMLIELADYLEVTLDCLVGRDLNFLQ